MEQEAQGLINEAARMKKEAERMFPGVVPSANVPSTPAPIKEKKRGRPSKVDAHAVQ